MQHPIATITMENGAQIVVELYPEEAPNTVNSFIFLARQGVFDHYAIQRVVPGWVPGATVHFTLPSREGISISAPTAAW